LPAPIVDPYAYSTPAQRIAARMSQCLTDASHVPAPYKMQLHLTDYCNLKCVFCPTKEFIPDESLDARRELTRERWEGLIDEAVAMGVQEFHICGGGEPFFFHEKALAVLKRIKDHGKYGEIVTNGTLIRQETLGHLVNLGWDAIDFSVDGASPEIHDRIRGRASFQLIVKNIARLAELKRESGVHKPVISIYFVVCSLNYQSLPGMVRLCASLGVERFYIQALNVWSDGIREYQLSAAQRGEFEILMGHTMELARDLGIVTNIAPFIEHSLFDKANSMDAAMSKEVSASKNAAILGAPCYRPWYNLSILADGRTLPCYLLRDRGESCKDRSLVEVWQGAYFSLQREGMLTNHLSNDCARCNPWSFTRTLSIRQELSR